MGSAHVYDILKKRFDKLKLGEDEEEESVIESSSAISTEEDLILIPKFQEVYVEEKEQTVMKYIKKSKAFDYIFKQSNN